MYLLINTGSSSVKVTAWSGEQAVRAHTFDLNDTVDLRGFAAGHGPLEAITHRVVHAGELRRHAPLTVDTEWCIRDAIPLAPLHNPLALRFIAAARAAFGKSVPQLAAVDTAFFATLPRAAATYALPAEVGPLRRYGFHGLAHSFMVRRAAELGVRRPRRLVTLQLGAGCSAAAVLDGAAADTSMGFSPLEGLMMATRAGDVDPGVLLYLLRARGYTGAELSTLLNERAGLVGVCGRADMADVVRAAGAGDAPAELALELYCRRIQKTIGAYAAVLGGIDAVIFGGGVGEHAPEVRRRVLEPLGWLGVELDGERNNDATGDERITTEASRVVAWVAHVDEAREMAGITADLMKEMYHGRIEHRPAAP
jgi:acetate kinase